MCEREEGLSFYLGAHQPSWLTKCRGVPLFVSHARLVNYRTLPRAVTHWALDSGAFSEIKEHGRWRMSPAEYVDRVKRYDREIGRMGWAAPQDWMCEPWMIERTGLSVREHQERTVENFVDVCRLWEQWDPSVRPIDQASCPFMPVLQGWSLADYWTCIDLYAQAGVRLADYPLVGLGSVCRRQATEEIGTIVRSLGAVLPLHGFGVKIEGLAAYGKWLTSADSMAWSLDGRHTPGCRPGHQSEANCLDFALAWRVRVLATTKTEPAEQQQLFPTIRGAA